VLPHYNIPSILQFFFVAVVIIFIFEISFQNSFNFNCSETFVFSNNNNENFHSWPFFQNKILEKKPKVEENKSTRPI
jgi:hypothetical protein